MTTRGAGAMDAYEGAYKEIGEYEYEKTDAMLPKRVLIFRKAMYFVQIIMVAGAGLVFMGAQIAQRNGFAYSNPPFGTMESELIFVPFAAGGATILAAIVGCLGVFIIII